MQRLCLQWKHPEGVPAGSPCDRTHGCTRGSRQAHPLPPAPLCAYTVVHTPHHAHTRTAVETASSPSTTAVQQLLCSPTGSYISAVVWQSVIRPGLGCRCARVYGLLSFVPALRHGGHCSVPRLACNKTSDEVPLTPPRALTRDYTSFLLILQGMPSNYKGFPSLASNITREVTHSWSSAQRW